MPSTANLNAGMDLNQSAVAPAMPAVDWPAAMRGAETPQAPMTVRHASPLPQMGQMRPQLLAPPPKSDRNGMQAPVLGNDPQLQMQLQAKAQSQIQAFQAMLQAQAQAYALSQIQPQVQALTRTNQSQAQVGQLQQPAAPPSSTAQAYAQMQQAFAQQSMMARQGTSKAKSLQQQQGQPQPQQQQPPSQTSEGNPAMMRQLQEQVVAQAWAQAQVQQQRESGNGGMAQAQLQQAQLMAGRGGRQTLVRQTSWARTSPRPSPPPPAQQFPPTNINQRPDTTRRTSDPNEILEMPSARSMEPVIVKPVQASASESRAVADTDAELLPGILVNIDGSKFEIMQALGMGSYGMVWSALSEESKEVAVKEILCRSQGELGIAHFEGSLLFKLGQIEAGACRNGRLPALVAQETHQMSGANQWRVRLAMSRIPGMPLMILLEQHRENKKNQSDPAAANGSAQTNEPQPFPERPEPRLAGETPLAALLRKLSEPSSYTKELIVQIFPTLERISAVAYHRDINPRNILIDSPNRPGPPNYGLVDFGMAVDSAQWRSNTRGNWNTLEVGGDCRYWPVSAWVMFLHGPQELPPGSPWRVEYQTQLDIHALGITALQVFVELLPSTQDCISGNDNDDDGCLRAEDSVLTRLKTLADAWAQYWEDAMDFWSCLIDCFTNNGDWNALKRACINHGVQEAITRDLMDLRVALSEVANALDSSDPCARELQAVFNAIRALISVGDSTEFPTWRSIHRTLGLPASMEDLASVKIGNGAANGRIGWGMGNSYSTNKLSTSTLTPGRSCYTMVSPSPGPMITRGISVANEAPKASPAAAQRQASVVRDTPSGSSTSRMISVAAAGSPMCSPRPATQMMFDANGRRAVLPFQHSNLREPVSGRRSSTNIAVSPTRPSRGLIRESSVAADKSNGSRSKSGLMPSSPSYGFSGQDFTSPWRADPNSPMNMLPMGVPPPFMPNSVMRSTSTAVAPQGSVVRAASVVTAPFPESGAPGGRSARGGGMVTVMTKNPSSSPDFSSPNQVIRGSSIVTSAKNFQRSSSPVTRGSSVIVETRDMSRGPSVVTSAANRGASVGVEAAPPTARRAASYVGDIPTSGPSPSQGVRLMMPAAQFPMLSARADSARQWGVPMEAVDQGSVANAQGVSVVTGATIPSGLGSGDSSVTAFSAGVAAFPPQMLSGIGIGGVPYS